MKTDNISVTIDGMKLYGACPNRMDPPISHVLANNIDYIEVTEGPFDVTQPGALGASVKVHTLEPTQEFQGEMNLGLGSWGYTKLSTYLSGGAGNFRFELGLSTERSDQYKDGNGRTLADQLDDYIASHPALAGVAYLPRYHDMEAYDKSTLMGKIYWDVTENSTLKFGYTANRSNDVLYPNSKMDADYDDSDLYDVGYEIRNLGIYSDKLTLQYYHTEVDHPMSTRYRKMSLGPMGIVKHQLQSQVDGVRIVNELTLGDHGLEGGLEFSRRNWDGKYYHHDTVEFDPARVHSIYDVDTDTYGAYLKDRYVMGDLTWDLGLRFDHVTTKTPRAGDRDRSFDGFGGNLMASYRVNESLTLFAALGSAMRVPDPKELYYRNKMGAMIGDDSLDPVRNYELDAGFELGYGAAALRFKGFYNYLQDDILLNSSLNMGMGKYENVDAYIYGIELSGSYQWNDALSFDAALAWNRGKKKDPLTGQSDTDLPDIAPLRFNAGVTWMPWDDTMLRAELLASARWDHVDSENGEQIIGGWGVVNLKAQKSWGEHLELTVGVDNLFDKTYAVSNTYKDLILVSGGLPMILNEPGRYVYTNIRWKF
jgi:iron complex outermembrane receptor protein